VNGEPAYAEEVADEAVADDVPDRDELVAAMEEIDQAGGL